MVKAATPSKFLKMVSGANCSDNKPGIAPNIVTTKATIGVPLFERVENTLGRSFCSDKDHIMRDAAYKPELAAESRAVIITKRMMSSAYGMPIN